MNAPAYFVGPNGGDRDVLPGQDLIDLLLRVWGEVLICDRRDGLMALVAPGKGGEAKSGREEINQEFSSLAHGGRVAGSRKRALLQNC